MSGHPDMRRIRRVSTYTVADLALALDKSNDTVLRWIEKGMPLISKRRPFLIDGEDTYRWLKLVREQRRHICPFGTMRCQKCGKAKRFKTGTLFVDIYKGARYQAKANCETCSTRMFRFVSVHDAPKWHELKTASTPAKSTLKRIDKSGVNAGFSAETNPDVKPQNKPALLSLDL